MEGSNNDIVELRGWPLALDFGGKSCVVICVFRFVVVVVVVVSCGGGPGRCCPLFLILILRFLVFVDRSRENIWNPEPYLKTQKCQEVWLKKNSHANWLRTWRLAKWLVTGV